MSFLCWDAEMKTRRRNNAFHPLSLIKRTRWSACVWETVYCIQYMQCTVREWRYFCTENKSQTKKLLLQYRSSLIANLHWQRFTRKLKLLSTWRTDATSSSQAQFNITVQWGCRGKNRLVRWPYSWLLLWPMKVIKHCENAA